MNVVERLGRIVWFQGEELQHAAAVIGTVLYLCVRPRYLGRAARDRLARQVLAVGLESVGFVCTVAVLLGISVVVQLSFWTGTAGQSQMLGPLLVAVVARELGPLLVNIVVIVRSNSVIVTELAILRVTGDAQASDVQQNDPFVNLVMPRVLAVAISTFCLTMVFVLVSLASGYLFGAWSLKGSRDIWFFTDTVLHALHPGDVSSIVAKSILPALFTSASSCVGGLDVHTVADIPNATQRALTRSVAGLFVISAFISLITYLKL